MKSPCLDRGDGKPCKLVDADKNNDECVNCTARIMYVDSIDRCLSSSVPMETMKIPGGIKMEEKKLCKKCGENPIINKYAKYCSPCLNAFRREKKASKIPKENKAASGMEKPEKARKTANAAVIIEFGKHASILTAVEKMADEEMRPVDMQIIYMLKKQLQIYEVQDES